MATGKFLLTDVYIEIDGVNLSNYGFNIDTPSVRQAVDVSGFSSTGAVETLAGQKDDTITAQFLQSFISGGPHDVLRSLYQSNATFSIKIRPTSGNLGADNPQLAGNGKLYSYNGLSGALNARSEMTCEFKAADSAGFVWSDT